MKRSLLVLALCAFTNAAPADADDPDEYFTEDRITETAIEGNYFFLEKYSLGGAFMRNDHSERFVLPLGYSF